ncbi:hypothetical protein AB1Y20_001245 [Prymnesium parvum]|uniref:Uncharacterized protein n=1 Tax=Prymnesium parvum TaxID=97485 RepID=A0AB34KBH8_PRYPA
MPRNPTQTDKPSTPEDSSWDGSPLTRYAWQKELPRRLTRIDPSFRTLCEYGYTVERSKVICANPTHRDHLYINNVTKRSFTNPCDILTFIRTDPTLTPAAVPAEAAARYISTSAILSRTMSSPCRSWRLPRTWQTSSLNLFPRHRFFRCATPL